MKTVYTAIGDDLNDLIDTLVKEKGVKKGDIVRDLLEKGLQADQLLLEAEQMRDKVLDVETVKQTIVELDKRYTDDLNMIGKAIAQAFNRLEEQIRKLGERPELITPEDAKILRDHIDTCTFPDCPYKAVFPELTPEKAETTEEQARPEATEHNPPRRWSLSDIGRKAD